MIMEQQWIINGGFHLPQEKFKFNFCYEENKPTVIDLGINKISITFNKNINNVLNNHWNVMEIMEKLEKERSCLKDFIDGNYSKKIFFPTIVDNLAIDYQWDTLSNKTYYREKQGQRLSCVVKNKEKLILVCQNPQYLSQLLGNILESLWSFNYKTSNVPKTFNLYVICEDEKFFDHLKPVIHGVESIFLVKYLGITPPNILYPKSYSKFIVNHFQNTPVKTMVLGEEDMKRLGMGAILCIGQGSPRESQIVLMEYGNGPKKINFIGKGITFDTGGTNLKTGNFSDMKFDMMGSATVVGIMDLLSKNSDLAKQFTIVGAVGLVENQIGGMATLPSDIVTSMEGKTIEILNTDAEGRVILADVISYCKKYFQDQWSCKPDVMMTFATLTGSMVECLSDTYCGVFTNSNSLGHKLMALGEETGDLTWMMPCSEYYNYIWENPNADIGNIHPRKGGGAIKGAKFIEFFVGSEIKFAHFDIAGVSDCVDRLNSNNCPTAYGIKLISEFMKTFGE